MTGSARQSRGGRRVAKAERANHCAQRIRDILRQSHRRWARRRRAFAHPTAAFAGTTGQPSFRRLRRYARAILHGRMRRGETGAPLAEQLFAQRSRLVGLLVAPAPGKLRHQHVSDILEISGRDRKRNVQAIDVGLVEPRFDFVGDLFGGAYDYRPDPAEADILCHLAHGPYTVLIGTADIVRRSPAVAILDVTNPLGTLAVIETSPVP